jgi:hypothetical protein
MEPFWSDLSLLLLRPEHSLTDEERDSVRSLTAFFDDLQGLGRTKERRWCAIARQIRALIRDLGRMPVDGDLEFTSAMRKWLAELRYEDLNPFQRAALECSEFWVWPVR